VASGDRVPVTGREQMRWKRRDEKLRKRKQQIIKHGKAFGEMVRNAVRKRQKADYVPPQQEEKR
jgi:hypothetical protein